MKKIILSIAILLMILILKTEGVLGVNTPLPPNQTTPISFPIPELSNCPDYTTCKAYCDQPTNYPACLNFAKSRGLMMTYPQTATPTATPTNPALVRLLADAKSYLGCDGYTACQTFCSKPANYQKCTAFKNQESSLIDSLTSPIIRVTSLTALLFQAAKNELGCDNETSCLNLCNQPENYQKCTYFAMKHQLISPPTPTTMPYPSTYLPVATPTGAPCATNPRLCPLQNSNNSQMPTPTGPNSGSQNPGYPTPPSYTYPNYTYPSYPNQNYTYPQPQNLPPQR